MPDVTIDVPATGPAALGRESARSRPGARSPSSCWLVGAGGVAYGQQRSVHGDDVGQTSAVRPGRRTRRPTWRSACRQRGRRRLIGTRRARGSALARRRRDGPKEPARRPPPPPPPPSKRHRLSEPLAQVKARRTELLPERTDLNPQAANGALAAATQAARSGAPDGLAPQLPLPPPEPPPPSSPPLAVRATREPSRSPPRKMRRSSTTDDVDHIPD